MVSELINFTQFALVGFNSWDECLWELNWFFWFWHFFYPSIVVINLNVLLVNELWRVCNFFGIYRVVIWSNFKENREVFMKKEKREAAVFFSLSSCSSSRAKLKMMKLTGQPLTVSVNVWPVQSKFDWFSQSLTGSTLFQLVQPFFSRFSPFSRCFKLVQAGLKCLGLVRAVFKIIIVII